MLACRLRFFFAVADLINFKTLVFFVVLLVVEGVSAHSPAFGLVFKLALIKHLSVGAPPQLEQEFFHLLIVDFALVVTVLIFL